MEEVEVFAIKLEHSGAIGTEPDCTIAVFIDRDQPGVSGFDGEVFEFLSIESPDTRAVARHPEVPFVIAGHRFEKDWFVVLLILCMACSGQSIVGDFLF